MKNPKHSPQGIVLLMLIAVFLLVNPAKAQQSLISVNGWNAYVHLPADYNSAANVSKSFPTILFFPGIGEVGTSASLVIANGPGAYITQGWNGNVQVGTDSVEFIVISLQPPAAYPQEYAMNAEIQTLKSMYRIDNKRLYLTGLSMGGWCTTTFVTGDPLGGPYTYASQVAAVVDVEGVKPDDNSPYPTLFNNFALSGGRLLGFQQANDDRDIPTIVSQMNLTASNSGIFIQTDFSGGGHCCWEQFYGGLGVQPGVFPIDGVNQTIYQWLARQNATNIPPVANAGPDQLVTLPVSSVTLTGSGTDADGTVVSYGWAQVAGPTQATITNALSTQATVSGLSMQGVYQFVLAVADNGGAIGQDTMQVIVNGPVLACNANAPKVYTFTTNGNQDIYQTNATTNAIYKGGDTIKIVGGNYTDVIEFDHIHGDPCHPITIINSGGLAYTTQIRLNNDCSYIHFTGSGTPGVTYGFKSTAGPLSVNMGNHIEIDHVEITNPTGGVGMFIKTIPDTTVPGSWYIKGSSSNYLLNSFNIHHNWIHNTEGEGMYIGATDPDGGQHGNDANGNPLIPLRLDSIEIANNLVEYTGWDGIQLSNARDGAKIHDNIVRHYGTINMSSQQAGIILGGNTSGSIYNNKITNGTGNGIQVFGYGIISTYNNFLDSTGYDLTTKGQESFVSNDYTTATEQDPKQQILIYGNSFNHPAPSAALRISSDNNNSISSNVHDNTFCIPGALSTWQSTYIVMNVGGPNVNNVLYCPASTTPIIPIANAGSDVTIKLPTSTATLSGSGSDVNGLIASYKWVQVSGPSTAAIANSALAQTSVSALVQGVYKFSLTVTDTSKTTAVDTMQVTVSAANIAPVANAGIDQTITLPVSSVTVSGSGTDVDGTVVSYLWAKISGPTSGTISSTTSATTTITGLAQGVYKFALTVTDNNGATGTDTMQVTVNAAANISPVSNAGADAMITLPVNSVTLSGSGTDADGTIASYLWAKISGPTAGTITSATSASTTVTSLADGTYKFSLTVTDNSGATSKDTVQVIVNAAPVSNAGSDIILTLPAAGTTLSVQTTTGVLTGSGTDVDGTIASYQWAQVSGPSSATIVSPTSATTSLTGLIAGTYKFSLTVKDNYNAIGRDTVQIIVNAPPIANAGIDQIITLPTSSVTLSGSGTDADGTIASYAWTKVSGPTSGTITSSTSAGTSVTALVAGVYKFTLKVTDNLGAQSADTMQVTVNAAIPVPVISSSATANGTTGIAFSYSITASNTPTSYTATALPTGLSVGSSTGMITGTPTVAGTFNVTINAINAGGTGTKTLTITINPPAPVISSNVTASGTTGTAFNYTIVASNTPTSYTATGLPTGLSISGTTGIISGTPTVTGTFNVTINAINAGGTGTKTLTITINPPAPVISSSATASGTTGTTFSFAIIASNTPASYTATGLPTGLSISGTTGIISGTPTVTGTFNVTINAINAGGTGTKTLTITINPPAPVISSSATASGTTGTTFSFAIIASNTPASYTATGLPTGLSISGTTGIISGTPTVTGTFNVTINAINAGGTGTSSLIVTIGIPPVANAGIDQTITLPLSSATLNGSATNTNGTITSYQWAKVSGPTSGSITNSGSASTTVTGLVAGVYKFGLTVTNSLGATAKDTVQITVLTKPTANAGTDQTIVLPANSTNLNGSATDAGGTIASYSWANVSGPDAVTIAGATSASASVTGLAQGTYKFTLTVTDNFGVTAKDTMQVTVNAAIGAVINIPPTAHAGVDQVITLPLNTVALNGNGTDADGTVASYQWTKMSGPVSGTITNATTASTTVTALTAGIYKFILTVTDDKGAIGKDTVQITVNTAPVANAGTDKIIVVPASSVTLNGVGTDADGTIASYQWTKISGPTSGTIINATTSGTTVTGLVAGVYKFALTVTDNFGAIGKDTIQVTVNIPPVANAGADQLITLPTNSVTLAGSGTDADGTVTSYQWTKISGPTAGTITNATTISGLVAGVYKLVLTVTDNLGATAKDTMQITVNTPPVANAGADQVITVPASSISLNGSGIDVDGTIASYQWSKISGPTTGTISSAGAAATTVTGLTAGTYKFALTVTDNNGATTKDTMQAIVNVPPVANAGADQIITLPISGVSLKGIGTDADGTITSYQWVKVSGPTASTINNATSANTTVTGLVQGVYKFALTVTDNYGGISNKDTMQVIVNIAPLADAGADQTIALPTNSVNVSATAVDVDGTVASYKWSEASGPSVATITKATSAATSVTGLTGGVYKFIVAVTDNNGGVGLDSMIVTVTGTVNTTPIANAGTDITIKLPANSVTLTGSGKDADGTIASYQWAQIAGTTATIDSATAATTKVTGLTTAGTYQFVLTVKDNLGATGNDTVLVTVKPVNVPPVANAGTDVTVALSDSVTLNGSGTDVDGTIVSYHWAKIAGPSKGSIGNASSATINLTNLGVGIYQYELAVTDNDGAKAKDTVTVTVTKNASMQVFAGPVPVQSSLTTQVSNISTTAQKLTVTLTSVSGVTVYNTVVPANQSSASMKIDMSNLRSGIYFLNIKADGSGQSVTKTIMKN